MKRLSSTEIQELIAGLREEAPPTPERSSGFFVTGALNFITRMSGELTRGAKFHCDEDGHYTLAETVFVPLWIVEDFTGCVVVIIHQMPLNLEVACTVSLWDNALPKGTKLF